MAQIQQPQPVKLIVGLLAGRAEWLDAAEARLVEHFGPIDLRSDDWPHEFTDYYAGQMGPGLIRRFVAFERLISPDRLGPIKRLSNDLEAELAGRLGQVPRPVNIDPGYLAQSKLVLASAKNFAHRIYLGEGIFAEITLLWRGGRWESLDWTFPDYASGLYHAFLTAARDRLRAQQKGDART